MAIPASVGTGSQLLRRLRARNIQSAFELATREGRRQIPKLLAAAADPCAQAILSWDGVAQGRVQGSRAICRFAELPDARVAVLDLLLETGGWRFEGARVLARDEYESFGHLDE